MYRFILDRLASLFVAALVIMLFLVQGCVRAATSTSSSPYGQSSYRQVCVAGNCRMVSDQDDTWLPSPRPGYEALRHQLSAADNESRGGLQCRGGERVALHRSTRTVQDHGRLHLAMRAPLNGTQFGTMGFRARSWALFGQLATSVTQA
jgi:hypothetical protein